MKLAAKIIAISAFLAFCSTSLAAELLVPTPYPTIQSAIDAAVDGDTVIVAPGTYTGEGNRDIDFKGKAITVRSVFPDDPCIAAATIIDCNGSPSEPHRGFYFHSGEDANSILNGLTITNGNGLHDYQPYQSVTAGGGIACYYSSPTIKNCLITENRGGRGGGICCENASPIISNCKITNNSGTGTFWRGAVRGGGFFGFNTNVSIIDCVISGNIGLLGCAIFIDKGSPLIDGCIIRNNSTINYGRGSLYFDGDVAPEITNCLITGNHAYPGGICNWYGGGSATISNCTIIHNTPYYWGGAIDWRDSPGTVTNCICRDNHRLDLSPGGRREIRVDSMTVNYTNIHDNGDPNGWKYVAGIGNIDIDPCFVEPGHWVDANDPNIIVEPNDSNAIWVDGDYHLLPYSLCIDAGDPNYIAEPNETDLDGLPRVIGGRIDMGAYEANYIEAAMKFTPPNLNCKSKGKFVKAHITLPEGFTPEDVALDTPAVAYPMNLESEYLEVFLNDYGSVELEITFDRQSFCDSLTETGQTEVTVIGSLTTGRYFYATDTITVKP